MDSVYREEWLPTAHFLDLSVLQHGQSAPLAVPQLGFCASSGRAWRLWAARHSQEEASPLGAQPLPQVLERAASKAADLTASVAPFRSFYYTLSFQLSFQVRPRVKARARVRAS